MGTEFLDVNARYSVLAWEPVPGSGEILNVGALLQYDGRVTSQMLIRREVLSCMYGSAGEGLANLINEVLCGAEEVANQFGWESALDSLPLSGFNFKPVDETFVLGESDAYRQIVLMHCSLSVLADEDSSSENEEPIAEREVSQQWTTKVKEAILIKHPKLGIYFNKDAKVIEGGIPVRFGFLSPRLAAHFGMLRATNQGQGMSSAKAKMWDLQLARERNQQIKAALIFGVPSISDITLTDRQRDHLISNIKELTEEGRQKHIEFKAVRTVDEAVEQIFQLA